MFNKDRKKLYIGLDFSGDNAMISFTTDSLDNPSTLSITPGREEFSIPLYMCYQKEEKRFSYGDEALRFSRAGLGELYDKILSRACKGQKAFVDGEAYEYTRLLARFIKRLVRMCETMMPDHTADQLVLTVETLTLNVIETFDKVIEMLEIPDLKVHIMDHRECFYYYALSQPVELSQNNIALFEYENEILKGMTLKRLQKSYPQLVDIEERDFGNIAYAPDDCFSDAITQMFGKDIYSAAYLVGDGFSEGWMKDSLKLLCRGRRAFQGQNLYSKGASYAARISGGSVKWGYVYMGLHTMKFNVSIKVNDGGNTSFLTLVSAGGRWFESSGNCQVILDGENAVDFWIHLPDRRDAKIENFLLRGLPERENKTTRVDITAKPVSDHEVRLIIKDLGFGEIAPSSGKVWEALVSV